VKPLLESAPLTSEDEFIWQLVWTRSFMLSHPLARDNYSIWQVARAADRRDADLMLNLACMRLTAEECFGCHCVLRTVVPEGQNDQLFIHLVPGSAKQRHPT